MLGLEEIKSGVCRKRAIEANTLQERWDADNIEHTQRYFKVSVSSIISHLTQNHLTNRILLPTYH